MRGALSCSPMAAPLGELAGVGTNGGTLRDFGVWQRGGGRMGPAGAALGERPAPELAAGPTGREGGSGLRGAAASSPRRAGRVRR